MSHFPGKELDRFSWRLLERAGISSDYQICKLGPEEVFVRVLKTQGACSLDFFYTLVGYVIDEDPKELAQDRELNRLLQARLGREWLSKNLSDKA